MNEDQYEKLKESFLDLLMQACGEWDTSKIPGVFRGYDSEYISTYEHALALAVELGWIKQEEVLR